MFGNTDLARGYTSRPQQVRRISEDWITQYGYCLRCESDKLTPTPANTRARDFTCSVCFHGYELKSKLGVFSSRVLDGAYGTMLSTIKAGSTPTLLLLEYSDAWSILGLTAIHHSLITDKCIEPRKPLAASARRAGWVGCNIMLPAIAREGQIALVRNGAMQPRDRSRMAFARLERLSQLSASNRTWVATILNLVGKLPERAFCLSDIYRFEPDLQKLFPRNKHIRPKIRQQLQVLRDVGIIHFKGEGHYELAQ